MLVCDLRLEICKILSRKTSLGKNVMSDSQANAIGVKVSFKNEKENKLAQNQDKI